MNNVVELFCLYFVLLSLLFQVNQRGHAIYHSCYPRGSYDNRDHHYSIRKCLYESQLYSLLSNFHKHNSSSDDLYSLIFLRTTPELMGRRGSFPPIPWSKMLYKEFSFSFFSSCFICFFYKFCKSRMSQ